MRINSLYRPQFLDISSQDLAQIFEIENRAYPYPWRLENLHDCLPTPQKKGAFAKKMLRDGEIIAYGFLSIGVGEADLLNITVDPTHQRQGLGRILLQYLIELAQQKNADTLFLEVRRSNISAQKLYDSFGFNQIGLRKNYYPNGKMREDALVMAKYIPLENH